MFASAFALDLSHPNVLLSCFYRSYKL